MIVFTRILFVALACFTIQPTAVADTVPAAPLEAAADQPPEKIAPYMARFGRTRPVIAVVGDNEGTVLGDYVVPYGVLAQSGVAEMVSVATQPGPLKLLPLQILPDATLAEFDQRYPDGADYVIVPAVKHNADPVLLAWVSGQAGKGATMVSICNGALVLANAGLTRGHRATGHWSTYRERVAKYPDTRWLQNVRYVADGKIVSSAGISAAMPTALALVEAIAGSDRAEELARQLGVGYWGTRHDSQVFHLTLGDGVTAFVNTVLRPTEDIGLPVAAGVDEIALALQAEAYDATMRSRVHTVAEDHAALRTRNGLMLVPERVAGSGQRLDRMLPALDATPSAQVLDQALDDINARYGAAAARFVVLETEYPWQGH